MPQCIWPGDPPPPFLEGVVGGKANGGGAPPPPPPSLHFVRNVGLFFWYGGVEQCVKPHNCQGVHNPSTTHRGALPCIVQRLHKDCCTPTIIQELGGVPTVRHYYGLLQERDRRFRIYRRSTPVFPTGTIPGPRSPLCYQREQPCTSHSKGVSSGKKAAQSKNHFHGVTDGYLG